MTRVVADTNVYIFSINVRRIAGRLSRPCLQQCIRSGIITCVLHELDEKLRNKFNVSADDAQMIRARLERVVNLVEPAFALHAVTDDPDDNRILECVVACKAQYAVSGDRHLLKMGSYEGMAILTVRQFLEVATPSK